MKKAVVSGGAGYVGRFIVEALLQSGYHVLISGRTRPADDFFSHPVAFRHMNLDPAADFSQLFADADLFVHAAFDHVSGRYRGGEGEDPKGFHNRNHDGSAAMFEAARAAAVKRAIFLSSRAVYGLQKPGVPLEEEMPCRPDTLYGEVKLAVEDYLRSLSRSDFDTMSLRLTGVYGPGGQGREHKWSGLIRDYLAGRPIASRVATEVHGKDVAAAILLLLDTPKWHEPVLNVSAITLDRRDVLAIVKQETGSSHALPAPAETSGLNVMETARLHALGWSPSGISALQSFLRTDLRR
jgi:nucleoside-diphosphate-sugar epimerase